MTPPVLNVLKTLWMSIYCSAPLSEYVFEKHNVSPVNTIRHHHSRFTAYYYHEWECCDCNVVMVTASISDGLQLGHMRSQPSWCYQLPHLLW